MEERGRYRNWCFTINNYTDAEISHLQSLHLRSRVAYIIFGRETGSNGTPHLQGYVELGVAMRLRSIKDLLGGSRVHCERRLGTPQQASEYCKKEGDYEEYGVQQRTRQGNRTDLNEVKASIDQGATMVDLANDHFTTFLRYERGLRSYVEMHNPHRSWKTIVTYYFGPTGSGKSSRVLQESEELCGNSIAWLSDSSLQWFEPYDGHTGVVIDDFTGSAPIALLLRLFDRYPMRVPIKGAFRNWLPRHIWITSNMSLYSLYGTSPQYAALRRRIDVIKHIIENSETDNEWDESSSL